MSKDNQRIALTKRLLKEGLLRLLKSKSLDKINITELCRESGINRATFYRHYSQPKDVLDEMQKDFVNHLYQFRDSYFASQASKAQLEKLCDYLYEYSDLVKIFIRYNSESEFTKIFNNFFDDFVRQQAAARGLHNLDAESILLLSTYLAGGGYFLLRLWLMEDMQKSPGEIVDLIWEFINKDFLLPG